MKALCLAISLVQVILMQSSEAADVLFSELFKNAVTVDGVYSIQTADNDVLVFREARISLHGADLFLSAANVRFEGISIVRAHPSFGTEGFAAAPKGGVAKEGKDKPTAGRCGENGCTGEEGGMGDWGAAGDEGKPAGSIRLHFQNISGQGRLIISNVGQAGGTGQTGGRGGNGGNGGRGMDNTCGFGGPGNGGDGGPGGIGGGGGPGGVGGAGGTISFTKATLPAIESGQLKFYVEGGLGGLGGKPGPGGSGGTFGNGGHGNSCIMQNGSGGRGGGNGRVGGGGSFGRQGKIGARGGLTCEDCREEAMSANEIAAIKRIQEHKDFWPDLIWSDDSHTATWPRDGHVSRYALMPINACASVKVQQLMIFEIPVPNIPFIHIPPAVGEVVTSEQTQNTCPPQPPNANSKVRIQLLANNRRPLLAFDEAAAPMSAGMHDKICDAYVAPEKCSPD